MEILQNGLRKKNAQIIKPSAAGDFDTAMILTQSYLKQIRQEHSHCLKRKDVSELLAVSMDTLRYWGMNGLLTPDTDIRAALNTPKQSEDIISVCDRLTVSLSAAEKNAVTIMDMLQEMKAQFL